MLPYFVVCILYPEFVHSSLYFLSDQNSLNFQETAGPSSSTPCIDGQEFFTCRISEPGGSTRKKGFSDNQYIQNTEQDTHLPITITPNNVSKSL